MDNTKKIEVSLKHLYWYLIDTCRYGYTRNNHLMPATAFDTCRELLPKIAEADAEYAIYIAKQLVEEAISDELVMHFYEGIDDEHMNRTKTIEFIKWCFDKIHIYEPDWKPYNYDMYLENIEHNNDKIYKINEVGYEYTIDELKDENLNIPCWVVSEEPMSVEEYLKFIYNLVSDGKSEIIYNKINLNSNSIVYKILEPVQRQFLIIRER